MRTSDLLAQIHLKLLRARTGFGAASGVLDQTIAEIRALPAVPGRDDIALAMRERLIDAMRAAAAFDQTLDALANETQNSHAFVKGTAAKA